MENDESWIILSTQVPFTVTLTVSKTQCVPGGSSGGDLEGFCVYESETE